MPIKINSGDDFAVITLDAEDMAKVTIDGKLVHGPKGPPVILHDLQDKTFYEGTNGIFEIAFSDGGEDCLVSWYFNGSLDSTGSDKSFDASNKPVGTHQLYCEVTNTLGSVTSTTVTVTILAVTSPIFVKQPDTGDIFTDETFTTSVAVDNGGSPVTLEWYLNDKAEPNSNEFVHTFSNLAEGLYSVKVKATNFHGETWSNEVSLTVRTVITLPKFSVHPNGGEAVEYGDFTSRCSIIDGGDPANITIQWYLDGVADGLPTIRREHTYTNLTPSGQHLVSAKVCNSKGCTVSDEAVLNVVDVPEPPSFTKNLPTQTKYKLNESKSLSVEVDTGGDSVSLEWYLDDVAIPNSDVLSIRLQSIGLKEGTNRLHCVATNSVASIQSLTCTVYYVVVPTVTQQPEDAESADNEATTFSAAFDGGFDPDGAERQWYYDNVAQPSYGGQFTVNNPSVGTHLIHCKGTNYAGSVLTRSAILTVKSHVQAPTFTTHPNGGTVYTNASFSSSVAVDWGGEVGTLQWFLDGVAQGGSNNTSFTFSGLSAGGHTIYCEATNSAGTSRSNTATINAIQSATNILTVGDGNFGAGFSEGDYGALTNASGVIGGNRIIVVASRDGKIYMQFKNKFSGTLRFYVEGKPNTSLETRLPFTGDYDCRVSAPTLASYIASRKGQKIRLVIERL